VFAKHFATTTKPLRTWLQFQNLEMISDFSPEKPFFWSNLVNSYHALQKDVNNIFQLRNIFAADTAYSSTIFRTWTRALTTYNLLNYTSKLICTCFEKFFARNFNKHSCLWHWLSNWSLYSYYTATLDFRAATDKQLCMY